MVLALLHRNEFHPECMDTKGTKCQTDFFFCCIFIWVTGLAILVQMQLGKNFLFPVGMSGDWWPINVNKYNASNPQVPVQFSSIPNTSKTVTEFHENFAQVKTDDMILLTVQE